MPQEPEPREQLESKQGLPPQEESALEFYYQPVGLKWIVLGLVVVVAIFAVLVRFVVRLLGR